MSEGAASDLTEEQFLERVTQLCAAAPSLSQLGAGILLAARLGICSDSRAFARIFGIEHALVLREVTDLAEKGLLTAVDRSARTQRTTIALTATSNALLSRT